MYPRSIEWVTAIRDAQKTRRLFKGLFPEPWYLLERLARLERTVLVTISHHIGGKCWRQARNTRQQRRRCRTQIHAYLVHTVLDRGIKTSRQGCLRDIVLVLPHANRLGINLHKLCQRILQAARNRDGTTNGHIQLGKLALGELRGGIHRRTGLGHHDLGESLFRHVRYQRIGKALGFAAGGAVADGNELDRVLAAQLTQACQRAFPVIARLVRKDRGVINHLACGIHHGHLDTSSKSGIQPECGAWAGGSCEQQIAHVRGKHTDGLGICTFAQAEKQFGLKASR